MAGGSQIIINKDGITFITPREFKVKAGQHKFEGPAKVDIKLPNLSPPEPICEECLRASASECSSYILR